MLFFSLFLSITIEDLNPFFLLFLFFFFDSVGENNESRLGDDGAADGEGAAIQGVDLEKEHSQGSFLKRKKKKNTLQNS